MRGRGGYRGQGTGYRVPRYEVHRATPSTTTNAVGKDAGHAIPATWYHVPCTLYPPAPRRSDLRRPPPPPGFEVTAALAPMKPAGDASWPARTNRRGRTTPARSTRER